MVETSIAAVVVERVLSWPLAAVVLGLMFRQPVVDFIERLESFKAKGPGVEGELTAGKATKQFEAEMNGRFDPLTTKRSEQIELALPEDVRSKRKAIEAYGGDEQLTRDGIANITRELRNLSFDLAGSEVVPVLIRHLAVTQALYKAEFVYRLIFGSQLSAMKLIAGEGPQTRQQVEAVYERAKKRSSVFYQEYPFENWLAFLLSQNCIVWDNDKLALTFFGRDFLGFVSSNGLLQKPH